MGFADANLWNPGARPDLLVAIDGPGHYYGHPNPSRNECIFYAGPTSPLRFSSSYFLFILGNPTSGNDGPLEENGLIYYLVFFKTPGDID